MGRKTVLCSADSTRYVVQEFFCSKGAATRQLGRNHMKDKKVRVQCEGDIERVIEYCRQGIPVQVISSVEMF